MRAYTNLLFILFTVLLTVSCENELPFNIKDNTPKLVMNALINADSLNNTLYLNFTGKENIAHLQNATVEIRVNGQLTETLRPLPLTSDHLSQCAFKITSRFSPGDVICIEATTDDGQYHVWSEVTVPQRLDEIESIDTLTVPLTFSYYTQNYMRYKITFKDLPNENNYYRIVVDKQMSLWGYNHEEGGDDYIYWTKHLNYKFIIREDIVLTDGQPGNVGDENSGLFETAKNIYGVFDDSRFKNTSYTMTIYNSPEVEMNSDLTGGYYDKLDVIIRLLSITETEYYYLKALNLVDSDAYDETINEPFRYPSNVHGGTGIVGVSTETSKKVRLRTWKR